MNQLALCLFVAFGLGAAASNGQVYTFGTLAGNSGFGSDDGTGSSAQFFNPSGVAVDTAGSVYVADSSNHTIRKTTPSGVVTTLAGLAGSSGSADGVGSDARFNNPMGVAVDKTGNVYVADRSNHTIRKITPDGTVSTLAGLAGVPNWTDGTGRNARFYYPNGLTVDSSDNLYVADTVSSTIRKITPDGVVSTLAGLAFSSGITDGVGSNARFCNPNGITVDSAGNLHVAEAYNCTIRKITPDGVVSTLAGLARFQGNVDGAGSSARFDGPNSVAVDKAGNVYVADTHSSTIRRITPGGEVITLAGLALVNGSTDGPGGSARFYYPDGVAVDSLGNLYVADTWNCVIRKVSPGNVVSTLAGLAGSRGNVDGIGGNARFYTPRGIAVDKAGNIYVADEDNHAIRQLTTNGVVRTLAGGAATGGSADGVGGEARFYFPTDVAVDSAGILYVADTWNLESGTFSGI